VEWAYTLCGLRLLADGEIPGLVPCAFPVPADVRVWLNRMPAAPRGGERTLWYQSHRVNRQGRPNLVIWRIVPEGAFYLLYDDETEFLIQPDGSQVWCTWGQAATVADAAVYLRGPVLGLVLRLRGVVCLHASAIALGRSAIAILGSARAGKSTTAAGFVSLGFSLLTDDVAALKAENGKFWVWPGYPRLNLWPDAAEALYGSASTLPRVTPSGGINDGWDKRYLGLEEDGQFHQTPLPLAAVYVLGERAADEDALRIDSLSARDAFITLTDETYMNYALDQSMRALEFRTLGQLVCTTPVRLVTPHGNLARLIDLCDTILRDYKELASAAV
jgi:hypothetical protein